MFVGNTNFLYENEENAYVVRVDSNLNAPPIEVKSISKTVPSVFILYQNYPNPFNPSTKIKFDIPLLRGVSAGRGVLVRLTVYDILGREIQTLIDQELKPGTYEIEFNTRANGNSPLPSGVYFYQLKTQGYVETKRMVLLK